MKPKQISRGFLEILTAAVVSGLLIVGISLYLTNLYDATQMGYGVLFGALNILFYAFVSSVIFVKKNIAWAVPIIVIKYSILIVVIYLLWFHGNALPVVTGMLSETILTALVWLLLKKAVFKKE